MRVSSDTNRDDTEEDDGLLHGVEADASNLGLSIVYQPEDEDSVVDIVFVHGLTGNAFNTWHHKASNTHWPRDFIKNGKTGISRARVITFGYRADVASFTGPASQSRLTHHANDLVGGLVGLREDTDSEDRKIIFVAHSLGGLVVERALQRSKDSEGAEDHLCQVETHAHGVLFLGTPHKGSSPAAFATSIAKALRRLRNRVNPDIIEILQRDSQVLADLDDWFARWFRRRNQGTDKVQITCFFEQLELPLVGYVRTIAHYLMLS
ncbi:MAG: hypothetical protein Q9165_002385 [Trypethelium subeluteriae]